MKITSSPAVIVLSFDITSWRAASCILLPASWTFLPPNPRLESSPGPLHLLCLSESQTTSAVLGLGQRLSKWGLSTPEELPAEPPTTRRIIYVAMCRASLNTRTECLPVFVVVFWVGEEKTFGQSGSGFFTLIPRMGWSQSDADQSILTCVSRILVDEMP